MLPGTIKTLRNKGMKTEYSEVIRVSNVDITPECSCLLFHKRSKKYICNQPLLSLKRHVLLCTF